MDFLLIYVSDDLKTWAIPSSSKGGLALNKADVWAERWFWVPEVYHVKGKFYMYYSADEHICVATSESPTGLFRQEVQQPMNGGEKCIDNSLFIDDNGKLRIVFHAHNSTAKIHPRQMYISKVNFITVDGKAVMEIDKNYITSMLSK